MDVLAEIPITVIRLEKTKTKKTFRIDPEVCLMTLVLSCGSTKTFYRMRGGGSCELEHEMA